MAASTFITYNTLLIVIFAVVAVYLLFRFWKYLRNELRIAPRRTFWDKFKIYFSIFIFSAILTSIILFIAAMISSTIASNAIVFTNSNSNSNSNSNLADLIKAFLWPHLIPYVLICLSIYIIIYPFFESIYLGKSTQGGAMEIQKWFENHIIDKFRSPWSFFIAIFIFIGIYLIPPTLILLIYRYFKMMTLLSFSTVAIFTYLDWFMIFPIIYLAYYSTIGSSQAWFAGLKANLRKNKKRLIYFIFSIFMIISVIVNLIVYLPLLFGQQLTPTLPRETSGFGGTIQNIIGFFIRQSPYISAADLKNWKIFINIVPLDFLIFFVFTCIFGILGFYAKFINKEPLNRPVLLIFAAYMVSGIAFQVFQYIITKWPWVFAVGNIFPNLNAFFTSSTEYHSVIQFVQIFVPSVILTKILTAIFLIYQLFFNKNLRETIQEAVLTQAISDKDIKVLKKYTKNKDPRIRKLVAEAVVHIVEHEPKNLEKLIPIFEDLIIDHSNDVVKTISPAIKIVSINIQLEKLYNTFQLGLGTEEDVNISEIRNIITEIGKIYPEKLQPLYEALYKGYVPDNAKGALMDVLRRLGGQFPELSYNICLPMLDRKTNQIRKGSLLIMKTLINDFKQKYPQIFEKMKSIAEEKGDPLRGSAIELMAYIASIEKSFVEEFLIDYKVLKNLNSESKQKVIGGLTQLIVAYPEYRERIFPEIIVGLSTENVILQQDIIMTLGVIAIQYQSEDYLSDIHPIFKEIAQRPINEKNRLLKQRSLDTFRFLYKARPEFLNLKEVQELFIIYLMNSEEEIRNEAIHLVNGFNFDLALNIYVQTLKNTKNRNVLKSVLNSIDEILNNENIKRLKDNDTELFSLYNTLVSLNINDQDIHEITIKILCQISENSADITNRSYPLLLSILNGNNDESAAIVLRFFVKIAQAVKETPKLYTMDLNYMKIYQDLIKRVNDIEKPKTRIAAIDSFLEFYNVDSSIHGEIFSLMTNLKNDKNYHVRATAMRTLTKISCDLPEIYFKSYDKEIESRWIEESRFEMSVLPLIKNNLNSKSEEIQNSIIYSLNYIMEKYKKSEAIKIFLFKLLKKRKKISINIVKTVIDCFSKLPSVETESNIIQKIRLLTNDKNSEIRECALKTLVTIFLKLEPLEVYQKQNNKKMVKAFNLLKFSTLRRRFIKDQDKSVKMAFITVATKIAIKFPELLEPMLLVKDFAEDKDQDISIFAIKSYFKYIDKYPEKMEITASYMRFMANTPDITAKNVLLRKLIHHHKIGDNLKYYLPTLLKLALDKDKTIRQRSLQIFKEIYETTSEKLLYFIQLLVKLTRDSDPRIRTDAFGLVANLTFQFPKNIQHQSLVFDTFSRLSRDHDESVKLVVSSYMEDLIKIFPERLNNTLQMIINLLREPDRNIVLNCVNGLRYMLLLYPKRAKEIEPMIVRLYRRSANPALQTLIEEFENK